MTDEKSNEDVPPLADARGQLLAATAVFADPNCGARLATPHIVHAWRSIRRALQDEDVDSPEDTDLSAWVSEHAKAHLDEATTKSVAEFVSTHASACDDGLARSMPNHAFDAQLNALRRFIETSAKGLPAAKRPPKTPRALWGRRLAIWGSVTLVAATIAFRPWQAVGVGQWRGAYYPGKDLRGDPDVRRVADVDFSWGLLPPTDSIPADRFAARWDTCLVLEEGQEIGVQLIADDGARLYIDDEVVLDLWEPPEDSELPFAHGRKVHVDAGVHAVRVEYIEEALMAEVHLVASFDPSVPPGPIPSSMLEFPGEDFDEDDPCKNVTP